MISIDFRYRFLSINHVWYRLYREQHIEKKSCKKNRKEHFCRPLDFMTISVNQAQVINMVPLRVSRLQEWHFFFIILSREYSKAKNCAQEVLEKECPEHANSRTYYMDVLFDNYNPFCKNFLYNAPTTVKTPPRKTERLVMTQRREPSSCKSCPRATSIVMNSARSNREKSSYISVFELWFVLFYSQLCHSLLI